MLHPVNFARLCYCDKCVKPVEDVETRHPNGVTRGPWSIKVRCHGEYCTLDLNEQQVESYLSGAAVPTPLLFFGGIFTPRPLSQTEISHFREMGVYSEPTIENHALGFDISYGRYVCAKCGQEFAYRKERSPCPGKKPALMETKQLPEPQKKMEAK